MAGSATAHHPPFGQAGGALSGCGRGARRGQSGACRSLSSPVHACIACLVSRRRLHPQPQAPGQHYSRHGQDEEKAPQQKLLEGLLFTQSGRRDLTRSRRGAPAERTRRGGEVQGVNPMRLARGPSYDTQEQSRGVLGIVRNSNPEDQPRCGETHSKTHSTRPPERSSGGRRFFRPLRFKPTHSDSLHSSSFTRRATRAVVGADFEKADRVYLKRLAPALAPCPRANPGLHWATLQASGRVALAPRRCAVTRA